MLHTLDLCYWSECVYCNHEARVNLDSEEQEVVKRCDHKKAAADDIKAAKLNSVGLLIQPELLDELKAAAYKCDGSGKLLRKPPVVDGRVSLGPRPSKLITSFINY